jgi:hypothetical protein
VESKKVDLIEVDSKIANSTLILFFFVGLGFELRFHA